MQMKDKIKPDHWSAIMSKLEREKGMTTEQAYEWMCNKFEVIEEDE